MSMWTGTSSFSSNYVPQPVPSYMPMGYHRCEHCNRLMKDGRECDCTTRDERPEPKKVQVKKYDWHEFKDHTKKGKRNGRNKRRDGYHDPVLVAGSVRPDGGRDSSGAERDGREKEMKPCPFCGGTALEVRMAYRKYKVRCERCVTVYGPAGYTPKEAREMWNRRQSGNVRAN